MVEINSNARIDFNMLDADKNGFLNLEKDRISQQDGAKFFIPIDGNIDPETFYLYNADKYEGEISEEILAKREAIHKAYEEIKDKQKPTMGLQEPEAQDVTLANNEVDFWSNKATENTYIIFLGCKILYKNGYYTTPDRPDIKPAKNIYEVSSILTQEKREKTVNDFKTKMENAKTNEEKRAIADILLEDLSSWHSELSPSYLEGNYYPDSKGQVMFAGFTIVFTVSEDFHPIFNKEILYKQLNCAEN